MNTFYSIKSLYEQSRRKLQGQGRKFAGLRYIDAFGEAYEFPAKSRAIKQVLENVAKQDRTGFDVFTNYNDEVVIKETKHLPMFHII